MYPHIMQMIVIEDPIVYSLRTCAVIVNLFILCCAARYWMEYKGGYPNQVWYRCIGHKGSGNRYLCRDSCPLSHRLTDNAICGGVCWGHIPN